VRAGAQHVAIREEALVLFAVELVQGALVDVAVVIQLREDVLRDLCVHGHRGAAELVEGDREPLVDVPVDRVVPVAELARRDALLQGPCLRRGPVFIGAADVERLVAREAQYRANTSAESTWMRLPRCGMLFT